jgi:MFS family permease
MSIGEAGALAAPSRPVPSRPARWRWLVTIAPVLGIATIASAIHGFTLPLVALVFDRWGLDADLVGLNAAAGTCGILLLGPFLPRIIVRVGLMPVVAASVVAATAALAAMAAMPNLVSWFVFKAMLGLSLSIIWTATELWINVAVDDGHRGRAFSMFTLLYWFGFGCGPMIITLAGVDGPMPLLIGAGLMASALPLLRLMPGSASAAADEAERRIVRLPVWPALMVLATALMAGLGDGSLAALLPTFGLDHGFAEADALTLLTAFVAGGILFQWPVGWLADRSSERTLALVCIAGAAGLLALLPIAVHDPALRLPLCFVAGGLVMSISPLGLTMVGRAFVGTRLTVMSTWFSIIYEVGCTIGPVAAGTAMVQWGPHGLPLTLVAAGLVVCAVLLAGAFFSKAPAAGQSPRIDPPAPSFG